MGYVISIQVVFFIERRCLIWRIVDSMDTLIDGDLGEPIDIPIEGGDEDNDLERAEFTAMKVWLRERATREEEQTKVIGRKRIRVDDGPNNDDLAYQMKHARTEDEYDRLRRRYNLSAGAGYHDPQTRCCVM